MAKGIQFSGRHRTCVVPIADVRELARELRRLFEPAYPQARTMAEWLDTAADGESRVTAELLPEETAALARALEGMHVAVELTDPLRCLWDELRADST